MDNQVLAESRPTESIPSFVLALWLVEPSINQITHIETQEQRSLEPRLMHLLCLLANDAGSVQTREHLIQTIWPKVIVNENSLTRAVSELRKKLSHASLQHCVIETIPKKGYRLTAKCQEHKPLTKPSAVATELQSANIDVASGHFWHSAIAKLNGVRSTAAAGTLALIAIVTLGALNTDNNLETALVAQRPLADINITGADALDSLIHARMDTVAASSNVAQLGVSNSEGSQPVISRDGRLFAQIRYSDEGSSLLLGSTDLPNSPVTVLNTEDVLYNLQWSPIDRALLFAQSPRITNAALLPEEQASLVMFDIDSFSTRVIQGPATVPQEEATQVKPNHFKLTSLGKHLGWLS